MVDVRTQVESAVPVRIECGWFLQEASGPAPGVDGVCFADRWYLLTDGVLRRRVHVVIEVATLTLSDSRILAEVWDDDAHDATVRLRVGDPLVARVLTRSASAGEAVTALDHLLRDRVSDSLGC